MIGSLKAKDQFLPFRWSRWLGYYALIFRGSKTSSLKEAKEPMCLGWSLPSFFCREEEWDPTQSQGKRPRPLTFDGRLLNMDWSDKANFSANQIFSESTRPSLFQDWFPLTAW